MGRGGERGVGAVRIEGFGCGEDEPKNKKRGFLRGGEIKRVVGDLGVEVEGDFGGFTSLSPSLQHSKKKTKPTFPLPLLLLPPPPFRI